MCLIAYINFDPLAFVVPLSLVEQVHARNHVRYFVWLAIKPQATLEQKH